MEAGTQVETVKFVSKGRNLRLTLLSPVDRPHPVTGDKLEIQKGFTAEFSRKPFEPFEDMTDGSFQWPPLPNDEYAPYVREDGIYVDPVSGAEVDVVARLRAHDYFGVQFDEYLDPQKLVEDQRKALGEITRAIAASDVDRLAEIYDAEESDQKREPVLTAAMEGLRAVEEALASEREPQSG